MIQLVKQILFATLIGLLGVMAPSLLLGFSPPVLDFKYYLLNSIPFSLVFLAFFVVSNRVRFSIWLTLLVSFLLFSVSKVKQYFLAEPLVVADFTNFDKWLNHADVLARYASSTLIFVVFVACLGLFLYLYRRSIPSAGVSYWHRITLLLIAVALLASPVFSSYVEQAYRLPNGSRPWEPSKEVVNYGLVRRLLANVMSATALPKAPEQQLVENVLQQYAKPLIVQDKNLPEVEKIIIILSESYFDPARLRRVEPGQYDLQSFRQLVSESYFGNLKVPTFGGLTLRTEFELLANVELRLFPRHRYPFFTLTNSERQSLVWDSRNLGYSSLAIHPNKASFWNRIHAYSNLGFERYISLKDFDITKKTGYYVSEQNFYRMIRNNLYPDLPQFIYAVSMENHGPWKKGRSGLDVKELKKIEMPGGLSEQSVIALQQYLFIRYRSQKETVSLVEYLKKQPYRSLVFFFGDHLPALHSTFAELGFEDGRKAYQQPAWFFIYDTHQNLNEALADKYSIREALSTAEVGSLLLSLVSPELPQFHYAALNLYQKMAGERDQSKVEELREQLSALQLWRFFTPPTDLQGKPFVGMNLLASGNEKAGASN